MTAIYEVTGVTLRGKGIGHTLGFPTANLAIPSGERPPDGVYIAKTRIEGENTPFFAIVNQGRHPTLPEGNPTIEAHLLDFSGDLYGKRLTIAYLHRLRPEMKFPSLDALTEQLLRDSADAREWIEKNGQKK